MKYKDITDISLPRNRYIYHELSFEEEIELQIRW